MGSLEPQWGILRERAGPPGDSERGSTLAVLERQVGEASPESLVEAVYSLGGRWLTTQRGLQPGVDGMGMLRYSMQ